MERCGWVSQDPLYIAYHDNEWGVPETDSKKLFEMIRTDDDHKRIFREPIS